MDVEPEIMKNVMVSSLTYNRQAEDGRISVEKFAEVVEMYNYYPIKVTRDRNKSNFVQYLNKSPEKD